MNAPQKLKKMEDILQILNDGLTKDDFESAFKIVLDTIDKLRKDNGTEFDQLRQSIETLSKKLADDNTIDMVQIKAECDVMMAQMLREQTSNLTHIREVIGRVRSGKDGKDGKNPDPKDVVPLVLEAMPEDVEETPQETRDKLETLTGDNRLDKSAIKGIDELEQEVKSIQIHPVKGGGGKGFMLYVNGHKKLLTAQTLNLIGGTGVSLSYDFSGGRNDITINATGGGAGLSVLTTASTIDDTNTAFVFASKPTLVIVNGNSYRESNGWSWNSGSNTATLDSPVGKGGDIYALG